MFFRKNPTGEEIGRLIARQRAQPFSYPEVGATKARGPTSYNIDQNRALLGRGREIFQSAIVAINEWRMFDISWIRLVPARPEVKEGETVAIVVKHLGFYSVNISRVVYRIREHDRYGFAYGTLPCHCEQGEERFMVEHDLSTGEVWYDLYAFSNPRALLARIGYPISRRLQRQFAKESMSAMQRIAMR